VLPNKKEIVLFGSLGLLLLLVAVLSYFFIRDIDSTYNSILSSEVRHATSLRTISRECGGIERHLLSLLLTDDSTETARLKAMVLASTKSIDKQILKLDNLKDFKQGDSLMQKLTDAVVRFRQSCGTFVALVDEGKKQEALSYDAKTMYPRMVALQKTQEEIAVFLSAQAVDHGNRASNRTTIFGYLTIGIAAVPFAAWILSGLMIAIYMVWMIGSRRPRPR